MMFGMLGTPLNLATRTYLNIKKVPQLFVAAVLLAIAEPGEISLGRSAFSRRSRVEGNFFGKQILRPPVPNTKIGVLYQYDDFGKELLAGLNDGLGPKAAQVLAAESFAPIDPTIDSQIVKMKSAGADTILLFCYAKQAAQAIRRSASRTGSPISTCIREPPRWSATLVPAGLENSVDIKAARYSKDPSDPQWLEDPELKSVFINGSSNTCPTCKSVRHLLSDRMDLRPNAWWRCCAGAATT